MKLLTMGKLRNREGNWTPTQDGAIWGNLLFRFGAEGRGLVYDLHSMEAVAPVTLDKGDLIPPHCNSVSFGCRYFCDGDAYPLLYCNVYNNFAAAKDPLCGVTCVYRIWRTNSGFETKLLQIIRVGFTEDRELWRSRGEDVRPYGNFLADREVPRFYGFVMRDGTATTRYFTFPLPEPDAGEVSESYGVPVITLQKEDILDFFDCPYHDYIQGACCRDGKIYSTEGFEDAAHPGAIRVIDLAERKQLLYWNIRKDGYLAEPECIDFFGDRLLYSDAYGAAYQVEF